MNELWLRVALVAGALAIAAVIALITRRRASKEVRTVRAESLGAGVYFFSAATCDTCERARVSLDSKLGAGGYTELAWERHPDVFAEHGVDQVPAVMVVDDSGRGRVYLGQPDLAVGP
jgi:hypothetical protein